jgi:uncharacterized protein YecE (DUF72 family)
MKLYIGTSGWVYNHWRGLFYPQGLAQAKWLEFYSQHFATVELNNSFYHLPSEKAFEAWRNRTPPGFVYTVKVSRLITHLKKLRNVETALETFLSRARLLHEKLGPLLYQLPPNMPRNEALLQAFLELLPRGLYHAFEFRNESWFDEEVFTLLRKYGIGFCIYDMPGFVTPIAATADFAYIRFHGSAGMYESCYSDSEIEAWANRIEKLGQRLTSVYVYFNNDSQAFAVRNAKMLARRLNVSIGKD